MVAKPGGRVVTALVVAAATLAASATVGLIAFIPQRWRRRLAWFSPWPRTSCARNDR